MRSLIDDRFKCRAAGVMPRPVQRFRHDNAQLRDAIELYALVRSEAWRLNEAVSGLEDDVPEDDPTLTAFHALDLLHLEAGALLEAAIASQVHAETVRALLSVIGVFAPGPDRIEEE